MKSEKIDLFLIYKLLKHDINKFIFFLRKGFYPYEHLDDLENLNEPSLPQKEYFFSDVNMGNTTDADYTHTKRVYKDLK